MNRGVECFEGVIVHEVASFYLPTAIMVCRKWSGRIGSRLPKMEPLVRGRLGEAYSLCEILVLAGRPRSPNSWYCCAISAVIDEALA